jgi:hypothetical protein
MHAQSDHGINLYLDDHSPHATYVDIKGATRAAHTLGTDYAAGDDLLIGGTLRLLLAVHVVFAGGGASKVKIKIEGEIVDDDNPGIFGLAALLSTRQDTAVVAFEHELTAAGDYLIICDAVRLTGKVVVSAKASAGTPDDGDSVAIHASAW